MLNTLLWEFYFWGIFFKEIQNEAIETLVMGVEPLHRHELAYPFLLCSLCPSFLRFLRSQSDISNRKERPPKALYGEINYKNRPIM